MHFILYMSELVPLVNSGCQTQQQSPVLGQLRPEQLAL